MNLKYNGQEKIPAGMDTVWAFVRDPQKIGQCLPEVVEVTVHDPQHFDAVVQVAVGPVRGKFKLKFEMTTNDATHHVDMKVSGGGFGSAVDLTAIADLADGGSSTTLLNWSGEAVARGPVAAVGGRVLDSQAKKLIEQTFAKVGQQLSAG